MVVMEVVLIPLKGETPEVKQLMFLRQLITLKIVTVTTTQLMAVAQETQGWRTQAQAKVQLKAVYLLLSSLTMTAQVLHQPYNIILMQV